MDSTVKWANELNRQFSKQVQTDNKYMKEMFTTHPAITIETENAIEHYAEISSYSSQKMNKSNAGKDDGGEINLLHYCGDYKSK